MYRSCGTRFAALIAIAVGAAVAGCRSTMPARPHSPLPDQTAEAARSPSGPGEPASGPAVRAVAFHQPTDPVAERVVVEDDPFPGDRELVVTHVVDAVLARNPSLEVATAAWQAAAQRYPQEIALSDPMFGCSIGPSSFGVDRIRPAYMVELQQKLPWPGKRPLRGSIADSTAQAAHGELHDVQLRLTLAAQQALVDYYEVHRARQLNDETVQLVRESRQTAEAKYRTGQVTQQDLLQADVELAELARRRLELDRRERVAVARINTLLHRRPDGSLPAPPAELPPAAPLPHVDTLRQIALNRRPDLASLTAQIDADSAAVNLAYREFYPDLAVVGRYNAFMQEEPLRPEVGLAVDVPLNRQRRWAAVREACFRLQQRRAELAARIDEANQEVALAYAAVEESRQALDLYRETLIPTAEQNLKSARAGYVTAKVDFLRLIEAQRQLVMLREKQLETEAEHHRRRAELERANGGPLPSA